MTEETTPTGEEATLTEADLILLSRAVTPLMLPQDLIDIVSGIVRRHVSKALAPEVIETKTALLALPIGTVVRTAVGTIACATGWERGVVFGHRQEFPWGDLALPVTVIYRKEPGDVY